MSGDGDNGELVCDILEKVWSAYFVEPLLLGVLDEFEHQWARVPGSVLNVSDAFRANIGGLVKAVSLPFRLASGAAHQTQFQDFYTKETVRAALLDRLSGEADGDYKARQESVALEKARGRMREFMQTGVGAKGLRDYCMRFLEGSLREEGVLDSAHELLLQGVVLCWGAFEVVVRDCFVMLLNRRPELVSVLFSDAGAKAKFQSFKVSFEFLGKYDYDLSGKMGSILAGQQDLSDFASVKVIYGALFPDDGALRAALSADDLRVMSKLRNLVVHRRGVVDEVYLGAVGCRQQVGERVEVLPGDVARYLRVSVASVLVVLESVGVALDS